MTQYRLSHRGLELFRRGLEIKAAGADEKWENEGGRRAEYIQI